VALIKALVQQCAIGDPLSAGGAADIDGMAARLAATSAISAASAEHYWALHALLLVPE
jgi:hypothetical protein